MQVKKDQTRDRILKAARQVFLQKGYTDATIRDLAVKSDIGVGNLYNYFKNKNQIFYTVVVPLINEFDRILYKHHDITNIAYFVDYVQGTSRTVFEDQLQEYYRLITKYRDLMELLFLKAQGSSLENFIDQYTENCTKQVIKFMNAANEQIPGVKSKCNGFTYHLHIVWMFQMFCEILKHKLKPKDSRQVVSDFVTFEYEGWKELIIR